MNRFIILIGLLGLTAAGSLFLLTRDKVEIEITPEQITQRIGEQTKKFKEEPKEEKTIKSTDDIGPQRPLANPPKEIKALYATNWSAGSAKKMNYLYDLLDTTELNAIVIDIKDYSGKIGYYTDSELIHEYGGEEIRIPKINALLKELHDRGVYVIGRVSVFQDQILLIARPDLALMSSSTGKIWRDRKGLGWVDPASQDVWDYTLEIANDAFARGFDEINFDYIRFPSDGSVSDLQFPIWDKSTSQRKSMETFFAYIRENLKGKTISADIFGLVPAAYDDLGIGQYFEDVLPYFDYVAPMTYPSHYASGVFGVSNPAAEPYIIINETMSRAIQRHIDLDSMINASTTEPIPLAKLRPWFQDFDLGVDYTPELVRAQITGLTAAASGTPEIIAGWMLWNPSNVYTREALIAQ